MQQARPPAEKSAVVREFVFAGEMAAMIAARDEVMDFLSGQGVSEEEEIDILVALQEAFSNAVIHGCGTDCTKTITCTVEVDPTEINIVVRDPGAGFDTSSGSHCAEDGTNLSQHGRGIALMRSLMDEIRYTRGGSELHMKKLRAQTPEVSASGEA